MRRNKRGTPTGTSRRAAALVCCALLWSCTTTPGSFTLRFGWAGGVVPPNLPAVMYLYSYITAGSGGDAGPAGQVHIATSGPELYSPGAALKFANVPNGTGLVATIQLQDSNGSAANILAYGQSAPFSLEPGKNVVVDVAQALHTVTSFPSSGGILVNGLMNGETGSSIVSLELFADATAVGAQISNLPAFEEGSATMVLPTLTPDPNGDPPAGFKAFRYDGWNLDQLGGNDGGLTQCTSVCQRSVYVFFTDKNQIRSATSSTTVTLNQQKPTLSTHVTASSTPSDPPVGGQGVTLTVIATPSEPLGVLAEGAPAITPHVYALADTTQEHEFAGFLGAPLAMTEYTFEHPISSATDTNGTYYVTFDLVDIAGNTNTVGLDQSVQFAIDTTAPIISNLLISRGQESCTDGGTADAGTGDGADAGTDAGMPGDVTQFSRVCGYDRIHLTFDSTKPLPQCTVGLGQTPTSCISTGTDSYSWDYAISMADPEGNHPLSVVAFDTAQNEAAVPNVSVSLDYTPPGLVASSTRVSLPNAGVHQTETLTLTPSEPLLFTPTPAVTGPASLLFSLASGPAYTFTHLVRAGDQSGQYATSVLMTDVVGNSAVLIGPTFNVDTVVPTITNVKTDAETYSEVGAAAGLPGYNIVTLMFDIPKSVGAGLVVTLSGRPMSCGAWEQTQPNYTCTYQVSNVASSFTDGGSSLADTAGPQTIQITATDEANNAASGSATVTFDFTTPTLTPNIAPNPANATGVVSSLDVTSSKPLQSATVVSISPVGQVTTGTVTADPLQGTGTAWSTNLYGTGADGQFDVALSGTDPVGHVGTSDITFTIDAIVPVITDVQTNGTTFSEKSPFNTVSVTFDTPKAGTVVATIGGLTMGCAAYQARPPSYTCTYTTTSTGSEGSGTKVIALTATDEVGNSSQASASVVFDFTAPVLTATVSPSPVTASSSPFVTVSSTKPLASAAVTSITPVGTAIGSVTSATLTGSTTSWSAALTGNRTDGSFSIAVQGTDALGHQAMTTQQFVIDVITPTISNVQTNAQTFSEVSPFDVVTVTFDTPKAATVTALVGGNTMTCGAYQASSPRYSCTYQLSMTGSEGSGTKTIALTAVDEVGNSSQQSTSVVFDFEAPALTPSAAPNPSNATAVPELTIASTKPLVEASVTSIDGAPGAIGQVSSGPVAGSDTSWSAALTGAGADGSFVITVSGADEVGHVVLATTTLVIDAIVPTITNLQANATTFSQVSPFSTVMVTFDTPKAATVGATVGGNLMSCTTQSSVPAMAVYSCTYGVSTTGSEGSGTKIISVIATDEVGNTSQASTSVVFDFAPLTLSPIVVPNPANATSAPVLTIAASKPLPAAPQISVAPQTGSSGNVSAGTPSGSGASWTSAIQGPGASGAFLLGIRATDAVGHLGIASTPFFIQAVPPVLGSVSTNATTYSEVPAFNRITLSFTSSEVLDTAPAQLTVQVGGKGMKCGTAQGSASPWSYSCTYGVSTQVDTAGTQAITIDAVDSAGNEATAGTSVTFDFTAPVLTPTVAPNPANNSSSPVLTVAVSKALPGQPTIGISPAGSLAAGGVSGGGTSWSFPLQAQGAVTGTFSISATGTDAVGHQATGSTSFVINTVPTLLSDISPDRLVYSERPTFNLVTLTFDSTEPLDVAPASLKVTIGSDAMTCGIYQVISASTPTNYSCTYLVRTTAGAGTKAITITAVDLAGNQTTAGTSVTFDFTAPTLTPTVAPNPANASASPALTVASDKVLDGAPTVTITPVGTVIGAVSAGTATGGGTSWGFPLQATGADGTFTISVQGSDSVGHTSTQSTLFTVDTVVPAIVASSVTTDRTTYSEEPTFNVITLTFQTQKAATTVTVSGGASSWSPCGYSPPVYTCQSAQLTGIEGSGTRTIAITVTDEVGNTSQASTSVVFDFTPPTLTPTVAPNPSNASSTPQLSISSSKPLTAASISSLVLASGSGTVTSGPVTGGGTSWSATLSGTGANGVFTLTASGTDDVGHTGTKSTSFTIDAITPTISNVATNLTTYSEETGFNIITLTFNTLKQATAVTVSGGASSWQLPCSYTAPTYTCTSLQLLGTEGSGTKTIAITTMDEVGNSSQASASVVFDFIPPVLTPTVAPNPANSTSLPELTIASSKPLTTASVTSIVLASGSGSVTSTVPNGTGTSWTSALTGVAAEGRFTLNVSGLDLVGHLAFQSTSFVIDDVVPTIDIEGTSSTSNGPGVTTFSEVPGYNVVYAAFDTLKGATPTAMSVTASVGGIAMACGAFQAATPNYSCSSPMLQVANGSGSKVVAITGTDAAANVGVASTTVTFDFTPPTLTATVTPNPANASATQATLTIASSKTLTSAAPNAPAILGIVRTGGSGTIPVPGVTGSGTSWNASLPLAVSLDGTFAITVAGTDLVGHSTQASTSLVVDGVVPSFTNPTITGGYESQRFSARPSFNVVSLAFGANKRLDIDGGTLTATVGGYAFGCVYTSDAGSWYACSYDIDGGEEANGVPIATLAQATMPVLLSTIDEVGNQATAQVTPPSVVFDFQAPSLASASAAPAAVSAGQNELLTLQANEALATGDGGTTLWPRVTFAGPVQLDAGVGTTIQSTIPEAADAAGLETTLVAMTDLVGNSATDAGPSFTVDAIIPTILSTSIAPTPGTTNGTTFSEVSSPVAYNLVQVTVETVKPATVMATLAGDTFGCPLQIPSTATYLCTYTILSTNAGSGSQIIAIVAKDEVGNVGTANPTVTFDFTQPLLTATVSPNPASAGASPTLTLASNKPLTGVATYAPAVTGLMKVSGAGSLALTVPSALTGSGTSWSLPLPLTGSPDGTFSITVEGQDLVGHQVTAPAVSFVVDAEGPTFTNPTISGGYQNQRFSAQPTFNQVSLAFGANKRLDTIDGGLTATVGGYSFTCTYDPDGGIAPDGGVSYGCIYGIKGTEESGDASITGLPQATMPIVLSAVDEVGNQTTAQVTPPSVVFDFQGPSLSASSASPSAVGAGQSELVTLQPNETLASDGGPFVSFTGQLTLATSSGTTIDLTIPTTVSATGVEKTTVTMTDLVGNSATDAGPSFTFDTVVPSFTNPEITGGYANSRFSAKPTFNVVSLTFGANKRLDVDGGTLTATVGGYEFGCVYTSDAGSWYACAYDIDGGEKSNGTPIASLAQATMPIALSAIDEVGNQGTTQVTPASVVFDFQAPYLISASASPSPIGAGQNELITLQANETLVTGDGGTTLSPVVTFAGPVALDAGVGTTIQTTIPEAADAAGLETTLVMMTDLVGNSATDAGPSFTVDAIIPTITNVTTDRTTYSEVSPFNVINLTFKTTKQATQVTVSGAASNWNGCSYLSPVYSCASSALSAGASGTKTIVITASDEAGNISTASTTVTLDFVPPTVTLTASPNPANASASPVLYLASSKTLGSTPTLFSITPVSGATVGTFTGSGTSWNASLSAPGADGTFAIVAQATDQVNHTVYPSTSFVVDATAPQFTNATITGGYQNQRFSAQTNFNVVSLAFGANKRLDIDGGTLTATVGGYGFGCVYSSDGGVFYACAYDIKGTELSGDASITGLPQATMPIVLSAVDEVGNQTTAQVTPPSVVFDFQAPYLTAASASPAPDASVGAGQSELITLEPSETLGTGDGGTTVWPAVAFTGPITLDAGIGTTIELTIPASQSASGVETSLVTMTDLVGNKATDAGPVFLVDTVEPIITGVATSSLAGAAETSFSAISTPVAYNTVVLKFNSTKSLDNPTPSVTLLDGVCSLPDGGSPDASDCAFQCGAWQLTPPSYTCTYGVTGHEETSAGVAISSLANATLPVIIEGHDEADNAASGSSAVTFDFMPPALVGSPTIQLIAAPNMFTTGTPAACLNRQNVLTTVTAATTCTDIRASFDITESLTANPTVTASAGVGAISFSPSTTAGDHYVYDGTTTAAGTPPDNAGFAVTIAATDLVGNAASLRPASPTFKLDTTSPASPVSAAGGPITYVRVPWGSSATGGVPSYSVTGDAGSAEPFGTVLAYDGPLTTSDIIGSGSVNSDGGFSSISLTRTDRPVVWLAAADSAGNESPIVAAHNVSWTATFDGKISGSTTANPHVMLGSGGGALSPSYGGSLTTGVNLFGDLTQETFAAEIPSYGGLFSGGASPLETTFGTPWYDVSQPSSTPPAREMAAMAYDSARGVSVLFGGYNSTGSDPTDTWEWNGSTSTWTQVLSTSTSAPSARQGAAMAYDAARGVTVLFSGQTGRSQYGNDTWEWNGTTWKQLSPPSTPPGRMQHSMVYDAARGVVVLFGGQDASTYLQDTWEWNGTAWRQVSCSGTNPCSPLGTSPPPRYAAAMAYDSGRGVSVLFGGTKSTGAAQDTWEWNGSLWSQRSPSNSPSARSDLSMAYDIERHLTVLFGGVGATYDSDTWVYNGTTWEQVGSGAPSGRSDQTMVYDAARGVSVLFGGNTNPTIVGDTWEWNGSVWVQRGSVQSPSVRTTATAYDSGQGLVVMFGGLGTGNAVYQDTWEWNGALWTNVTAATITASNTPAARYFPGMAYDPMHRVSVLFGGVGSTYFNDTWEWNSATASWAELSPSTSPTSSSLGPAMAYDAVKGVTMLFGGYNSTADSAQTWEWSGSNWTNVTPGTITATNNPPARDGAAMAFDASRGVVVLFGGENFPTRQNFLDTWEWNGASQSWAQVNCSGSPCVPNVLTPPARNGAALAYNTNRGVTVLFGGSTSGGVLSDTWEWNGSTWREVFPSSSPAARSNGSLVFDSGRSEGLLFGGMDAAGDVFGDTWALPSNTNQYPVDIAQFDFSATGETFASVDLGRISMSVTAGGTGSTTVAAPGSGSPVYGTGLAVWDTAAAGVWRLLATNSASAASPGALAYSTSSSWEASQYEGAGLEQSIDFAVFPLQPTGTGADAGLVAANDPELTVSYVHSESTCTAAGTSCVCAADEIQCGSLCSNVASDPQNCGTCATDGGVICASGNWCIAGVCQCPGTEVSCEGVCVDRTADPLNCGTCGMACPAGATCQAGICTGVYELASSATPGRCLTAPGLTDGGFAPGGTLEIWDCNGGLGQEFAYSAGNLLALGWCLDVYGGSPDAGTPVTLWPCNNLSHEQWTINPNGTITSELNGDCLDVRGDAPNSPNGTVVQMNPCNGGQGQVWIQ